MTERSDYRYQELKIDEWLDKFPGGFDPRKIGDNFHCSPRVYIDVGAHIGFYSLDWAWPVLSQVYAFEPLPANAEQLISVAKKLNKTNIEVIQKAVCGRDGETTFYVKPSGKPGDLGSAGSTIRGDKSFIRNPALNVRTITVETVRLSTFVRERGITSVHVLKIDAEGADYEILQDLLDTEVPVTQPDGSVSLAPAITMFNNIFFEDMGTKIPSMIEERHRIVPRLIETVPGKCFVQVGHERYLMII